MLHLHSMLAHVRHHPQPSTCKCLSGPGAHDLGSPEGSCSYCSRGEEALLDAWTLALNSEVMLNGSCTRGGICGNLGCNLRQCAEYTSSRLACT